MVEVLIAEAGRMPPEVAGGGLRSFDQWPLIRPRDRTAIGGDADAELAAGRQDLILDAARDQRIFDLQVGDRVDGVGAAQRLRADLRQAGYRT